MTKLKPIHPGGVLREEFMEPLDLILEARDGSATDSAECVRDC